MALKKQKEFSSGQTGEYWKIITFYPDMRIKIITSVVIGCYKDEQARLDGKDYFYSETFPLDIPYEFGGMNTEHIYEEIKKSNLNEQGEEQNWFADAEDC